MKSPCRTFDAALRERSLLAVHDPAAAHSRVGRDPRRGLRGYGRKALSLVLIVVVAGVWGHDLGTAAADVRAPRPETFQQLLTNMAQAKTGQQAHVVAEPYYIVGPPRAVEDRSR